MNEKDMIDVSRLTSCKTSLAVFCLSEFLESANLNGKDSDVKKWRKKMESWLEVP